jgi:putative ABC transport system ATP-binding protein
MVTHEADMAAYAHRIVHFRDGVVEDDRPNRSRPVLLDPSGPE